MYYIRFVFEHCVSKSASSTAPLRRVKEFESVFCSTIHSSIDFMHGLEHHNLHRSVGLQAPAPDQPIS